MKAVLFDVYETLLTGTRHTNREAGLRRVLLDFGMNYPDNQSLAERLDQEIRREHACSPEPHPEVDIRELWQRVFPDLEDVDAFALAAEESIHPVLEMPGAKETIHKLHRMELRLGIISNAQAYTRTLLARHLGETWKYFDSELLFFSYEHRIAKPDTHLFHLAKERLRLDGIQPHEILMVGDSKEHDIEPARFLGFEVRHVRDRTLDIPL